MSELAKIDEAGEAPTQLVPTQALQAWLAEASNARPIALGLAKSGYIPHGMSTEQAIGVIMSGASIGLDPTASLQSIDMIQGRPALRSVALRGLALRKGHQIEVVESTSERAIVKARAWHEPSQSFGEWQTSTWTIERAKDLGLLSKDQWKKQPGAMLVARATAEVARWVMADVLMGAPYISEEVQHGGSYRPAARVTVTSAADTVARLTPPPAVEASPEPAVIDLGRAEEYDPTLDDDWGGDAA